MKETDEEEREYNVGSLLAFKDLTKEQKDIFIKLISDDYSYLFQVLFNIIEDDNLVLEIIDILAGQKIQFPTRKKLYKLLEKIKIYTFVKNKNYSQDSCKLLAKQYNKIIENLAKKTYNMMEENKSKAKIKAFTALQKGKLKIMALTGINIPV